MAQPTKSPTASPLKQKPGSSTSTCSRPTLVVKLIAGRGFEPLIVDVAGDILDPAAPDAEHRFDLPADDKFDVVISVPRPVWAVYPLDGLVHRFRPASETESETEKIEAKIVKDAHGGYALERPHPRLTLVTTSASGATPACVRLDVDLRFLRVTKYFQKSYAFHLRRDGAPLDVELEQLEYSYNDPDAEQSRYRTKDARVELFELTTGDSPKLWCVVWRNSMGLAGEYQTSVFFMPKGVAYKTAGEAQFMSLKRYLLTPARPKPFFIWAPVNNPQLAEPTVDLVKPVVTPKHAPTRTHPLADECKFEDSAISCAMIDQLVESGKRVLLVLPMPNGEGAGAWGPMVTKPGCLTQHLLALQRAVHTVRKEWPRTAKEETTKASVGGFSAGAQPAYLALSLNPKRFNGFFWFDVPESEARQHEWLQKWIDGDSSRKVWLIGGYHYTALSTARSNIDRSSNVKLLPARASHYTADGTAYSKAIAEPPGCPGWTALVLEPKAIKKPGGVFAATGVFGDVASGKIKTLLKAETTATPPSVVQDHTAASTSEALGLLVFRWRYDHTVPIHELAPLKKLTKYLTDQMYPLRHSWTAFGGEVFGERGSGFISFFGACLRDWAP